MFPDCDNPTVGFTTDVTPVIEMYRQEMEKCESMINSLLEEGYGISDEWGAVNARVDRYTALAAEADRLNGISSQALDAYENAEADDPEKERLLQELCEAGNAFDAALYDENGNNVYTELEQARRDAADCENRAETNLQNLETYRGYYESAAQNYYYYMSLFGC